MEGAEADGGAESYDFLSELPRGMGTLSLLHTFIGRSKMHRQDQSEGGAECPVPTHKPGQVTDKSVGLHYPVTGGTEDELGKSSTVISRNSFITGAIRLPEWPHLVPLDF